VSPLSDPRAYRAVDVDGQAVECGIGDDGLVWLVVGGTVARLGAGAAMHLGGRLNGAGQRAVHALKVARAAQAAEGS
jgi:hypothetical protein